MPHFIRHYRRTTGQIGEGVKALNGHSEETISMSVGLLTIMAVSLFFIIHRSPSRQILVYSYIKTLRDHLLPSHSCGSYTWTIRIRIPTPSSSDKVKTRQLMSSLSRERAVVLWLGYAMYNREIVVRFPGKDNRFFSSAKPPVHLRYLTQPHVQWVLGELGHAVAQWLRHCATNRKVAGSIPDGVFGIFHWHNLSGRTMTLWLNSASNRNEYQEYFLGVKAAGA
jgi:hypothetical protein